jgi:FKBP-type peptidyl-prolyl cis-trans isomerase 2
MDAVKKGDKVKIEYTGTLDDGTVFDSSEDHKGPLEFVVGNGELFKGFEQAVIGMKIGEEKEIRIPPEEAYGPHRSDLIKDMPKDCFPKDQEVKIGMVYMIALQNGRQIPVKIANVSKESITVDVNHPLAGKTLIFKVKLIHIAA